MLLRSPAPARLLHLFVVCAVLATAVGCSTTYKIRMRGVIPDQEKTVVAASRVSVEKVPELKEDEHDPVIESKIVHMLESVGYEVVDKAEAEYVLLYNVETTPVASRHSISAGQSGRGGMKITTNPGPFEKSVRLHMLEAEPYRRDGTEVVLWSCHTVMPKVPNSSPRFEDVLLVGTFQHFPEDTGAVVTWRIALNEGEAKELHKLDPVGN